MPLTLDFHHNILFWCHRWIRLLYLRHGVLLVLCLLLPQIQATMYEGDSCKTKFDEPGICTLGSKCTILREEVNAGKISNDDVVSCGRAPREEIVCCPSPEADVLTSTTVRTAGDGKHYFGTHTATTVEPDFWQHLLTTTTTTTTPKPLVIGDQELNNNSEYYDFSKLLNKPTSSERARDNGINPSRAGRQDSNNFSNVRNPAQMNQITHDQSKWQGKDSFGQFQGPPGPTNTPPTQNRPSNLGPPQNGVMNNLRPIPGGQIQQPGFERDNAQKGDTWSANGRNFFYPSITEKRPTWETDNQIGGGSLPTRNIWPMSPQNSRNIGRQFGTQQQWGNNNYNIEIFSVGPATNPGFNAPLIRPTERDWEATDTNQIAFPSGGSRVRKPSVQPSNIAYTDPISTVNANLINSGMDLVAAKLDKVDRSWEQNRQQLLVATTQRSTKPDPFLPFEFRPSPSGTSGTLSNQIVDQSARPTKDSKDPAQVDATVRTPTRVAERPAVEACRRLEANMSPSLTQHILNGLPADEGEYPHMAAIGFSQIGEDISSGRYDWDCGGTLIESRFVLTAAHCVNSRERRPVVVRLGVVNVTDPSGTTVPIKEVHIHNDYRGSSKYNDIAILELEQDLDFGKLSNVYPTCLYTDLKDPAETEKLYVTGWGTTDVRTRSTSHILLHAVVRSVPLDKCNETYFRDGLINRQLQYGLDKSQLCAYDTESDACQGDSGGPLQWSLDKAFPKYRVVGIISAGISCGTETPALYTRVASYLDYIESIVWPDPER